MNMTEEGLKIRILKDLYQLSNGRIYQNGMSNELKRFIMRLEGEGLVTITRAHNRYDHLKITDLGKKFADEH